MKNFGIFFWAEIITVIHKIKMIHEIFTIVFFVIHRQLVLEVEIFPFLEILGIYSASLHFRSDNNMMKIEVLTLEKKKVKIILSKLKLWEIWSVNM